MFHAQIAQRAFNTPLLVEPSKAMAFLSGLGPRITGRQLRMTGLEVSPEDIAHAAPPARAGILTHDLAVQYQRDGQTPFAMLNGVAVIEVSGVLVHRGAWIGQSSGQTSYEGIAAQVSAAASDPSVRGIALEIDSFGGELAGVFDLADAIRTAREAKRVWAFVAEHAFSAGYALASQADRIILPRTGAVGSIGVVVMHADLSGQLSDAGVTVTLIHSGAHKVDGNPYAPLPVPVRARIQAEIDSIRTLFAQTAAAGRGRRLTADAAIATEAECYRGADAVAAGLADEVSDPASAFAAFVAAVNGRGTIRSAGPGSPAPSQLSKESIMKPNATTATDTPATDQSEEQAVPAPVEPSPTPTAPPAPASTEAATAVALVRAEAAELATVGAQAVRLGVTIDVADAVQKGIRPDALRASVLNQLAARSDAAAIAVVPPPKSAAPESPLLAAVKRAASAQKSA
ncbi:MAG: serine peptidase [Rhodobacterales bacterium 17-64-5]|nr:MAG: serine peptidase [Rhodobacterales bacterium 17-64-5]